MIIWLSGDEEKRAFDAGVARAAVVAAFGLRNNDGRVTLPERTRDNHVLACRTEIATSKPLHLSWDPQIGVLGGPDVGGIVEVRGRRCPPGGDLAMFPPKHKDAAPYVLCYAHADRSIELVGWLFGHEMRARGGPEHYGIVYVAPPYHSIAELLERFAAATIAG